jgi:hypothetical protein
MSARDFAERFVPVTSGSRRWTTYGIAEPDDDFWNVENKGD